MTTQSAPTKIAGEISTADWAKARATLSPGGTPESWQQTYRDFFETRLELRYLEPIRLLQKSGSFRGEGFSILAIQCSLIEFLESTLRGMSYRYLRQGQPRLGPYEYSKSGPMFIDFLCNREPFKREFNPNLARDFYENVRCGLLHEARTKNGWRILARGPSNEIVNVANRTVYRNGFQDALDQFNRWYAQELPNRIDLQEAFLRKFDDLCQ